jgi:hypothetical protein
VFESSFGPLISKRINRVRHNQLQEGTTDLEQISISMSVREDTDATTNECKCYNVFSSKPITNKYKVFDVLQRWLKNDKSRQLAMASSKLDHEQDQDVVRDKLIWNEMRKFANSLVDESDPQRSPISDWGPTQAVTESHEEYATMRERSNSLSDGMMAMQSVDGRHSVVIPGRGADQSFEDPDVFELDDIEQSRQKMKEKEAKKAAKKAKKEAKKAKKEAKKAKKESKKRKRVEDEGSS